MVLLLLVGGVLLCVLSGWMLRVAYRLRSAYVRIKRGIRSKDVPPLPGRLVMMAGWGVMFGGSSAMFIAGGALIVWVFAR